MSNKYCVYYFGSCCRLSCFQSEQGCLGPGMDAGLTSRMWRIIDLLQMLTCIYLLTRRYGFCLDMSDIKYYVIGCQMTTLVKGMVY